jgi:penicillin-binding protein 2
MARRLIVLRAVVVIAFALICGRLVQLQIVEGAHNRRLADENRIRIVRRLAPRGTICDRRDRVLASSRPALSVCVVPEELRVAGAADAAVGLAELLGMSPADLRSALKDVKSAYYEPALLWRDADPEVVARLEENALYLSGVSVVAESARYYPHGPLGAHVLGYVREVSPEELARPEYADYRARDLVGKAGIEKVAQQALRGIDGGDQIEVDARGRRVRTLGTVAPRPGRRVWLTLDLSIQRAAEEALGDRPGAVVAMNPWTGDILALVGRPAYDPNVFAGSLTPDEWSRLTGSGFPLHNRATSSEYPPGSLFKLITAAAALEAGACDLDSRFYCSGSYSLGSWRLRCWKPEGHRDIDFIEGFARSCNVMFATLGRRVGAERLADMARRFGLGEKCGIDLPQEAAGLVPDAEWKRRQRRERWYPGDTCQMAIGQGDCLATPLQMAREFAVVANKGHLVTPRVIARVEGDGEQQPILRRPVGLAPETIAALRAGLEAVVAAGGTAHSVASDRYSMAGKTGTAQAPGGPPHAWFAGYAPADQPRLVVVVIVEHGGAGSAVAAPIARRILDAALLPPEEQPPSPEGLSVASASVSDD